MQQLKNLIKLIDNNIYIIAFAIALGSFLASMVLSNVVDLPPCDLCWYQRIAMFPLPFLLFAAVLTNDKRGYIYVLPLAVAGALVALYQSLLQWGIISEEALTCSLNGPSCGDPEILWLGFLTIPFGAFLSFGAIAALMFRSGQLQKFKLNLASSAQKQLQYVLVGSAVLLAISVLIIEIFES